MLRRIGPLASAPVAALAALAVLGSTGCLTGQYRIDHAELTRLSQLPSEERGERVRVVQQTKFNADSPSETGSSAPTSTATDDGDVSTQTLVVVDGEQRYRHEHRRRHDDATHQNPDNKNSDDAGGAAAAAIALAAGVAVVTGTAFFVAAPTEADRFDGWVSTNTSEPLLLVGHDGDRRWVSLGDLNSEDAAGASHGVLLDGGDVTRVGRAPLDRFGFASRLEIGGATLSAKGGTADYAPQMRLTFGGFPLHRVGVLVGGQFAAGSVPEGPTSDSTVFNGRAFGEVDWFPLRLGAFYGGVFAEVGVGTARQDIGGISLARNGMTLAGGALCEIAITTRLAFSVRANAASIPSLTPMASIWVPEFAVGLSVY